MIFSRWRWQGDPMGSVKFLYFLMVNDVFEFGNCLVFLNMKKKTNLSSFFFKKQTINTKNTVCG